MTRSQLNIKIDPELLRQVKSTAIKQGLTVTEFVSQVLSAAVGDPDASTETIEERLSRIEKHLGLSEQG